MTNPLPYPGYALTAQEQKAYNDGYNAGMLGLAKIPPNEEIAKRRKISHYTATTYRTQWLKGHADAETTRAAEQGIKPTT